MDHSNCGIGLFVLCDCENSLWRIAHAQILALESKVNLVGSSLSGAKLRYRAINIVAVC